jgi:UDP-N-acetylglucosamine acyltransferase
MPTISPLAQISPQAVIADDVEIGPFCIVGPHVTLASGNRLISHAVITGHTTVGKNNTFYPHCVVGGDPQDKKFRGGDTRLEIGDDNHIRENATIHTGTEVGGGVTRVGNRNLIMINCHVAHDVQMANYCILANCVQLAGHVVVEDGVNIGGLVGVHHFVTIGKYAYIGGLTRVRRDVPPFVKIDEYERVRAINKEGLVRARFSPDDIAALKAACRRLFRRHQPLSLAMRALADDGHLNQHVQHLLDFLHRRDLGQNGRYLETLRSAESLAGPPRR